MNLKIGLEKEDKEINDLEISLINVKKKLL